MNILRTIFVLILLSVNWLVQAENKDNKYLLSKDSYDLLKLIQNSMAEDQHQSAIQKLKKYLNKKNIKPYDIAVINQNLAYVYNALENYPLAIEYFLKAIDSNALPAKVTHELMYILAQLHIHSEKYIIGLNHLEKWFAKEINPSSNAHLLAASTYYQTNQFNQLITHAKAAIKKSDIPKQSWYELLIAGYYATEKFHDAALLLETMISKYPHHDSYWLQLASVYQQNKQEKKALAISELAYEKGILKSNDIIQLAKTYLYLQLPFKAARILDLELNKGAIEPSKTNIKLLVNSWLLAHDKEKAAFILQKYVSDLDDISLHYKLGHIYVELENWDKARDTLEVVVAYNDITNQLNIEASAWLLLGISSFHKKDISRSTQALNKALSFKETMDNARWWLNQIENEISNGKG